MPTLERVKVPLGQKTLFKHILHTPRGEEIVGALSEYGIPVFQSLTVQRQSYPRSASEGRTVLDTQDTEAASEVNDLVDELIDKFTPGEICHVA